MAAVNLTAALADLTEWVGDAPPSARVFVLDETGGGRRCHKQRAADAVAMAAAEAGHEQMTTGSCGNYGVALAVAAARLDLAAIIVVPASYGQADTHRMHDLGAQVIRSGDTYEDAVAASRRLAEGGGMADANIDGPFGTAAVTALGEIVTGLDAIAGGPPAALWVPLGNGTTVAAVGQAIRRRGWTTPVFGASSPGNNSILESWPSDKHRPISPTILTPTATNEPLVNWDALHGQPALDLLHATAGGAVAVTDAQLESAHRTLRRAGFTTSPAGAAGVAGLLLASAGTGLTGGSHVAVLTG
jgi:threonine synthase